MCLYIDYIKTKQWLNSEFTEFEFYKIFVKRAGCLETPYHNYRVTGPGLQNIPEAQHPKELMGRLSIESGIFHARTDVAATKTDRFFAEYFSNNKIVCLCLPIIVKKEDIVAFGIQDDVGVLAYRISNEAWENREKVCQ